MTRHDRGPGGRIEVCIDEVVLDGAVTGAHEQDRFRADLEAELARLLTEHGLPASLPDAHAAHGGRDSREPVAPVDLRGGSVVDGAARIAAGVYESIRRAVPS